MDALRGPPCGVSDSPTTTGGGENTFPRGKHVLASTGSLLDAAAGRHLADAEDDEFRGLHRGETDLANQLAGVHHLGWVGLGVALDVERLLRGGAHERAVAPQ